MQFLDLTLNTSAANVALDEALLDEAEASGQPRETLRLWEPSRPLVVIGRGSPAASEVQLDYCRQQGIPVVRRASGGAAIVAGPGCLMYAVVLSSELRPELRSLDQTHRMVLETLARGIGTLLPGVAHHGTSDLAYAGGEGGLPCKFSGNSVRVKRRHVLYHGTLLYDFPLPLVAACLGIAPRQPAYRAGRDHRSFVANLPVAASQLRQAIVEAWQPADVRTDWPQYGVEQILARRYGQPDWLVVPGGDGEGAVEPGAVSPV